MTDFDPASASNQLRVIRSLMERATVYRSLSAPTALVGGLLSFGGLALAYASDQLRGRPLSNVEFLLIWLVILVITGVTNGYFLWRESVRRGTDFFSAGMRCAFRSVAPPILCGGIFTLLVPTPAGLALFWILFYGLGLIAMQHFAPRSIVVLGWCFLVAGLGAMTYMAAASVTPNTADPLAACWLMALTFGLFHIVYAVAVWTLGEERAGATLPTSTESGNV